ncbi:Protein kinase C-binding protein 1 [Branchiostoma belcheri]|nr:Protein kinase C-binding protein 1 [Branchiostoma belcheri]
MAEVGRMCRKCGSFEVSLRPPAATGVEDVTPRDNIITPWGQNTDPGDDDTPTPGGDTPTAGDCDPREPGGWCGEEEPPGCCCTAICFPLPASANQHAPYHLIDRTKQEIKHAVAQLSTKMEGQPKRSKESPSGSHDSLKRKSPPEESGEGKTQDRNHSKSAKKKKKRPSSPYTKPPPPVNQDKDSRNDFYCWLCHREGSVLCCELCPRVYHTRCLKLAQEPDGDWVCPECEKIMSAECVDTQSKAMGMVTVEKLSKLLLHSLQRMKHSGAEPFQNPVDPAQAPNYREYIFHPMDLSTLERNIKKSKYGCTQAFIADTKWILHNCIIFNGSNNKLTTSARMIVRICEHEMYEIEVCPDCYTSSCTKKDNWFCEPCREPHILVWAKLKGFPFWPAKVLQEVDGQLDVRFFGQHDRAWVPVENCFIMSEEIPFPVKKQKGSFDNAVAEMNIYIENLRRKFGSFEYAAYRSPYDKNRAYTHNKVSPVSNAPTGKVRKINDVARKLGKHASKPNFAAMLAHKGEPGVRSDSASEQSLVLEEIDYGTYASTPSSITTASPLPSIDSAEPVNVTSPASYTTDASNGKIPTAELEHNSLQHVADVLGGEGGLPAVSPPLSTARKSSSLLQTIESCKAKLGINEVGELPPPEEDGEEGESERGEPAREEKMEVDLSKGGEKMDVDPIVDVEKIDSDSGERMEVDHTYSKSADEKGEDSPDIGLRLDCDSDSDSHDLVIDLGEDSTSRKKEKDSREVKQEKLAKSDTERDLSPPALSPVSAVSVTTATQAPTLQKATVTMVTPEHRASVNALHLSRSLAIVLTSCHEVLAAVRSFLTPLFQDNRGLPLFLVPWGFQSRAVLEPVTMDSLSKEWTQRQLKRSSQEYLQKQLTQKDPPAQTPGTMTLRSAAKPAPATATSTAAPVSQTFPRFVQVSTAVQQTAHSQPGIVGQSPVVSSPSPVTSSASSSSTTHTTTTSTENTDDISKYTDKVVEVVKGTFQQMWADLGRRGDNLATVKHLQLEVEKLSWRHRQEMAEMKHNMELTMAEMRQSLELEKQRLIQDLRRQCEADKNRAVEEAKKKQWCAFCGKEAIFYCCWNTSYCDYPCQQAHWPVHMNTCSQSTNNSTAQGATDQSEATSGESPTNQVRAAVSIQQAPADSQVKGQAGSSNVTEEEWREKQRESLTSVLQQQKKEQAQVSYTQVSQPGVQVRYIQPAASQPQTVQTIATVRPGSTIIVQRPSSVAQVVQPVASVSSIPVLRPQTSGAAQVLQPAGILQPVAALTSNSSSSFTLPSQ